MEFDLKEEKRVRNIKFREKSRQLQVRMWTASSIYVLESIWRQKLRWLLTWPDLDRVTLRGPTWDLIVKGEDMEVLLREPTNKPWKRLKCVLGNFLHKSMEKAREQLSAGFEQRGRWTTCSSFDEGVTIESPRWKMDVEEVKEWLNGYGPGVRFKPEPRFRVQLRR